MNDILYCAIHTVNQKERVEWIKSTWGKNKNVIFYGDYQDIENNVYKISEKSDYSSGQEKQIKIFDFLNNHFNNHEWYFFCDNDTFINTNKINQDIELFDKDKVTCLSINHWDQDRSLFYPSGGAGFVINNRLMQKIFTMPFQIYTNLVFGDVSFGLNCRNHKIELSNNSLFNGMDPYFYGLQISEAINYYTFHYIKTLELMKALTDVCN